MESGSYKDFRDFSKYRLSRADLSIFDPVTFSQAGCGANALGLLTGVCPTKFKTKSNHYPDSFMVKSLRRRGFSVFKITKSNLTNTKDVYMKLDDRNCILMSQLLNKGNASWCVQMFGQIYHNFEMQKNSFWNLINFPISTAYVVYKKEWA